MNGRTPSVLEHAGPDHATAALALAGPGIATVLALGLGWALRLPAVPAGLALHAGVLALLVAGPVLPVLACRPPAAHQRRLRHGVLIAVTLVGALAAWWAAIPATLALPSLVLAQVLVLAWLALPGLTAAGDGWRLAVTAGLGVALALLAGTVGRSVGGDAGLLWGMASGPAAAAVLLHLRLRNQMAATAATSDGHLLLAIGGACATGLWWDALATWRGPGSQPLVGALRMASGEGACVLLAHLAAIPVLGLALIRCGSTFTRGRARFRATLLHGGDLATIMTAKQDLVAALERELALLVHLQALVALALVLCAPPLVQALGLPPSALIVLCLDVAGASVLVPLLVVATLLLAGGWRRPALQMTLVFTTVSLLAALPALWPCGIPAGWGRLLGGGVALVLGLRALRRHLTDLEYESLSREPLRA